VRIVAACSQRQLTPREFADLVNKPARQVTNHFRALETAGWLRRVREGVNRGVHTHPFTAERQAVVGDKEFAQMSAKERLEVSRGVVLDLFRRFQEALDAGTLDARTDSHFTWSPHELDESGWTDLADTLNGTFERCLEIQAESSVRLRESGESPILATVALAGFESPAMETSKAP